jgi:hypothetical protein
LVVPSHRIDNIDEGGVGPPIAAGVKDLQASELESMTMSGLARQLAESRSPASPADRDDFFI